MTYLFYDLETSGLCPSFDQIFRFACIITDHNLNEIDRHEISIKLRPDVVPSPAALAVTRLSLEDIKEGVCENEAMHEIHSLFNRPNQINIGYNSLNFDNNMLRFGFYRNLLDPYSHQYKNKTFRADAMNINLIYFLYKNDIFSWDSDKPLKLENINNLNHLFDGKSHDAMVDVEVTLNLSKKLRSYDNRMWEYLINGFIKSNDLSRLNKLPKIQINKKNYTIGVYTDIQLGYKYKCCCAVLLLGRHSIYSNQMLWMKLDYPDISEYFNSSDKKPRIISRRDGEPGFILPWEDSYNYIIGNERVKNVKKNILWLEKNSHLLDELSSREQDFQYDNIENLDLDASIYTSGLFNTSEKQLIKSFHSLNLENKVEYLNSLNNRIKALGLRIMFRNYPDYLDIVTKESVVSSIINSESVNIQKIKRRTPDDGLKEAHELINSNKIDHEQMTILDDYIKYLKSINT